jgi:hypothetical protein
MATQRRRATTVHLTRRTYDALQQRAQRVGKDADALADEMLEKAIEQAQPAPRETEREMIRRVLREGGLVVRDGSEYQTMVPPGLDLEAIRDELAAMHLDPPLSETIIQMRDEE